MNELGHKECTRQVFLGISSDLPFSNIDGSRCQKHMGPTCSLPVLVVGCKIPLKNNNEAIKWSFRGFCDLLKGIPAEVLNGPVSYPLSVPHTQTASSLCLFHTVSPVPFCVYRSCGEQAGRQAGRKPGVPAPTALTRQNNQWAVIREPKRVLIDSTQRLFAHKDLGPWQTDPSTGCPS